MAHPTVAEAQRPAGTDGAALPNPATGGADWFHGTAVSPEELTNGFCDPAAVHSDAYEEPEAEEGWSWSAVLGTHFAAGHRTADEFARGEHESYANEPGGEGFDGNYVVHAQLAIANPRVYASEHDMDHEVYEHEWQAGNHPAAFLAGEEYADEHWPVASAVAARFGTGLIPRQASDCGLGGQGLHPARTMWLASHPDKYGIAVRFREHLQAGHDGVIYGNEYETSFDGSAANWCAIAFDPEQITVTAHHDVGDLCTDRELDREAC